MKKAILLISLLLVTTLGFGQMTYRDSIKLVRDSLMKEVKHLLSGCSDFEIHGNPIWAGKDPGSKTYYKNCMWSGTYIVLNPDSTFLFLHNGEGSANYLKKGTWSTQKSDIVTLKGDEQLTKEFMLKMKQFEKTNYQSTISFVRKFIRTQTSLLEPDK